MYGWKTVLIAALLTTPVAAFAQVAPARPQFLQGSMNVFRRFATGDRAKMIEFYQTALALAPLQPIQVNASLQMILFRVGGTGQIKLATGLTEGRNYHVGGIAEATGIRLLTLTFPDEAAVVARFRAGGYPAPPFKTVAGKRVAFVKDPAGFDLELVIAPGTTGVEVGINVTDLARSRAFYRDFAGLEELPPVRDAALGVTKYPFRHGETVISLWSVGKDLPADTGSAGIQYVIGNIDAADAAAKAQGVTVETPLGGVPGFNIGTVWLNDPDGVTNYFYQLGAKSDAPK